MSAIKALEHIGWETPADLLLIAATTARMAARQRGPDDPLASVSRVLEAVWRVAAEGDATALAVVDAWARSYLASRDGD